MDELQQRAKSSSGYRARPIRDAIDLHHEEERQTQPRGEDEDSRDAHTGGGGGRNTRLTSSPLACGTRERARRAERRHRRYRLPISSIRYVCLSLSLARVLRASKEARSYGSRNKNLD